MAPLPHILPNPSLARTGYRVAIWYGLAAVIAIDAVWLISTPLSLSVSSWQVLVRLAPMMVIGFWGVLRLQDHPRLQMLCEGGAFLVIAWPALRLYNHLTMSAGLPLADARLAHADTIIGFDWLAYALWLDRHPALLRIMDYTYTGLTSYSMLLFCFLLLSRDVVSKCREMLILFFVTAFTCSTIGMFFPALAAAAYYGHTADLFQNIDPAVGSYHLQHFAALRSNPDHILNLNNLPGLVTFPSFHTAMGIVAIYCARGTPWLLAPSICINVTMIASTPLLGSHYLIDVIAGAMIAGIAICVLRQQHPLTIPLNLHRQRVKPA